MTPKRRPRSSEGLGFNPKLYTNLRTLWSHPQKAERYRKYYLNRITPNGDERLKLITDEDFISLYLLTELIETNIGTPLIPKGQGRLTKDQCRDLTDQMRRDKTAGHLVTPPISTHGHLYAYYSILLGAAYLTLVWRDPDLPVEPTIEPLALVKKDNHAPLQR